MLFRRSKSMTPAEAANAMAGGELQLVDVRESRELAEVRIDGATHIPLGQLKARLGELDHDRPVAFLCASGHRSAIATRAASKSGLDATNVQGGLKDWTRAGLPLSVSTGRAAT
jgi:rhodanese-related sulfurtransferase